MMTETPISSQTNCRLKLSNITKRFGSLVANDNISLSLAAGEVLAILGENGAGKTTLMNILFGHYVSEEGSIEVNGEPLPPGQPQASLKQGIGMVHQHFTLADNLSVLDNITLGTEPLFQLYRNDKAARRRLAELSERFGLVIKPDTLVANLSVGEKQRVEILKALYRGASVLILDEPTAVLTPQEAQQLFSILKQMVAEGLSIIFISHKLHDIVTPIQGELAADWVFEASAVPVIKKAARLANDFEIDWVAVSMMIDLMQQKEALERENAAYRLQLERFIEG